MSTHALSSFWCFVLHQFWRTYPWDDDPDAIWCRRCGEWR